MQKERKWTRRQFVILSSLLAAGGGLGLPIFGKKLFDLFFAPPCARTDRDMDYFTIAHPELMAAYRQINQEVIPYYGIGEAGRIALEGILYRELYDFGFSPLCVEAVTEAKIKAGLNDRFRSSNPEASFGPLNIKPVAVSGSVFKELPPAVQNELSFNPALNHVEPESLSGYLDPADFWQSLSRSLWIAGAIITAYRRDLQPALISYGYNQEAIGFILETCYAGGAGWVKFFRTEDRNSWLRNPENHHLYDRRGADRFQP